MRSISPRPTHDRRRAERRSSLPGSRRREQEGGKQEGGKLEGGKLEVGKLEGGKQEVGKLESGKQKSRKHEGWRQEGGGQQSSATMVCLKLLSQSTKALVVQAQGMPRAV